MSSKIHFIMIKPRWKKTENSRFIVFLSEKSLYIKAFHKIPFFLFLQNCKRSRSFFILLITSFGPLFFFCKRTMRKSSQSHKACCCIKDIVDTYSFWETHWKTSRTRHVQSVSQKLYVYIKWEGVSPQLFN